MSSNITKEELDLLANPHDGKVATCDSDHEAADPLKVQAYCEERDKAYELEQKEKRQKQRDEFIANEKIKEKIWRDQKKAKRDKRAAAKAQKDKAEREAFNLRYAQARKEKESAYRTKRVSDYDDSQSHVSTLTTPDCHPVKKTKKVTSSKKKLPVQKNTMTNWLVPTTSTPSTPSVASPAPSVSVTTTTSTVSATYTTPNVARVPPSITPYSGNHIDSSWVSKSTDGVDMTKICVGCNNPFSSCYEGRWRRVCLHQVLDYLEDKNFENVSERSVRRVYYKTFLLMMKAHVLDETDYWELEDQIHLPRCMLEGSLKEAYELMTDDKHYEYMQSYRVHDVPRHLEKTRNNVFRGECGEGEKIVKYGKK